MTDKVCINVKISADKLEALLSSGYLCAADIQCHNRVARDVVRQLCLKACGRHLRHP